MSKRRPFALTIFKIDDCLWLEADALHGKFDVRFAPESRTQFNDVRFRPADDRFCTGSGHSDSGSRRLEMTHFGHLEQILASYLGKPASTNCFCIQLMRF